MGLPILIRTVRAVTGEECHRSRLATMRERKSRIGAGGGRGGDAGHDFKIDSMRGEVVHLFAQTTEDAGIATLEADNQTTLTHFAHEDGIDLVLGHGVNPTTLADRHDLGRDRNLRQQGITGEGVMDDDIRALEQTEPPYGDQIGSPRSGTDEDHPAYVAIYHLFKLDPIYVILGNLIKY